MFKGNIIDITKGSRHKKKGKFGKNSKLGFTPPPRIIQNFLKNVRTGQDALGLVRICLERSGHVQTGKNMSEQARKAQHR